MGHSQGTAGQWFDKGFKGGSTCFNRTNDKTLCLKETRGVCGCNKSEVGEKECFTRTRICSKCCLSPESHERASLYAAMKLRKMDRGSSRLFPKGRFLWVDGGVGDSGVIRQFSETVEEE